MQAPDFWRKRGLYSTLLLPVAGLYYLFSLCRNIIARPYMASVPVVCIGNATAGGAGKTPVVIELVRYLRSQGKRVVICSKGYGGQLRGPVVVDTDLHVAEEVGDEPLLLAQYTTVVVAYDRVAGIQMAETLSPHIILMDDGLQNPHVAKTRSLLVVDGTTCFRNARILPSGPLREPVKCALKRTALTVWMGGEKHSVPQNWPQPLVYGQFQPVDAAPSKDEVYIAFAGIGNPSKFFIMLTQCGYDVREVVSFPDHHPYSKEDMDYLMMLAEHHQACLITTEKDAVRLPEPLREKVAVMNVYVVFDQPDILYRTVQEVLP